MAIMINTATSLISDVIGNDSKNSAFVYGCYSLFEKFANGGLLYWILAKYTEDDTPEEIAGMVQDMNDACNAVHLGNKKLLF